MPVRRPDAGRFLRKPDKAVGATRCDLEYTVPYALFENNERLTRPFRTEDEVWEAAERADLLTTDSHGARVLENNFEIKPCEARPEEFIASGQDFFFPERGSDAITARRTSLETVPTPAADGTAQPAKSRS
jgi:hypothetical protein